MGALRERPHTLKELANRSGPPPLVLPIIYHLIWNHRIDLNLSQPLAGNTLLAARRQIGEPHK